MKELTGAIIATSLVLMAVFIPVAFIPGTTGIVYKQFALTVACSIAISTFNALTYTSGGKSGGRTSPTYLNDFLCRAFRIFAFGNL
nr:efflux RND transporter permease subunit [Nostoc flagelliforme]